MQNVLNFIKTYWKECISVATILIAFISYIIGKFKNNKELKAEKNNLNVFTTTMFELITEAEKFIHYSGEEKQKFVLTRLREKYGDLFNEETYKQYIDYFVAFTKSVNFKGGK